MDNMNKLNMILDIHSENSKDILFQKLVDSIENCRLCEGMECRTKVLSEYNGNIYSNVLFIAEAPGRLGADRTGIPLFGDQTGVNFQRLIDTINWSREDFFITNAVLCNPRDEKGNNTTPTKVHIKNCSLYLEILLNIMKPEYIITLGQKALDSLRTIHNININLSRDVRKIINWNGTNLIPLYHTGPRAMVHRNYYNQLSDFYWLHNNIKVKANSWDKLKKSNLKKKIAECKTPQSKLQKLVLEILSRTGEISEFKLTKLLYLIDYNSLKERGKLVTNAYYLRSYNGPIPAGLDRELKNLLEIGLIKRQSGFSIGNTEIKNLFSSDDKEIIDRIVEKYKDETDARIKTISYMTVPMKRILRSEGKEGLKMLHKPVFSEEDFIFINKE